MFNTYYLSHLGFEILLSLTVKEDILVPTEKVLSKADKQQVYTQLGVMAKNGFITHDEQDGKISVKPEILRIFKEIAESKRITIINSHLENGGAVCIYANEAFVAVELTAFRPGSVKLTLIENDRLEDYLREVSWISEDTDDSRDGSILMTANFYTVPNTTPQVTALILNEKNDKELLIKQDDFSCNSENYTLSGFAKIVEDFLIPDTSLGGLDL